MLIQGTDSSISVCPLLLETSHGRTNSIEKRCSLTQHRCITQSNISQIITPSPITCGEELVSAHTCHELRFSESFLSSNCLLYCGTVLSYGCITMFRTNLLLPFVGSKLLAYECCRLCRHVACKLQGKLQGDFSQHGTVCLLLAHKCTWSHKPKNPNLKNICVNLRLVVDQISACFSMSIRHEMPKK